MIELRLDRLPLVASCPVGVVEVTAISKWLAACLTDIWPEPAWQGVSYRQSASYDELPCAPEEPCSVYLGHSQGVTLLWLA